VNLPPDPRQHQNPFQPPPVGSYGGQYQGGPPASLPASSEAVAALVCGLLAWGCFPLGFVALWLGLRARRAVRENPTQVGGDQLALAGMIVGGIFAGLGILVLLLYFVVFAGVMLSSSGIVK
jgi:hypothetical protein